MKKVIVVFRILSIKYNGCGNYLYIRCSNLKLMNLCYNLRKYSVEFIS